MIKRRYIIDQVKEIFEKYGFEPLETPTLELWETLSGKYGEEGDRLTYRFIDRGKREVGLRYDLTVPLSRVVAMYPEIPKPFKRYQIQPVWRADKPQKGRFREFYQCDIDVIGSTSMLAEAEILSAIYEILRKLGFQEFTMRINSRKILSGITEVTGLSAEKEADVARGIDKLDKIGHEGVRHELISSGIDTDQVEKILAVLDIEGTNTEKLRKTSHLLQSSETGIQGVTEMNVLIDYLSMYGIPEKFVLFDLFLARGLDYYTGPIFETVISKPRIGSITGGGRYDRLIGMFSGTDQPATGCSIGLERIVAVMEELNMFPPHLRTPVQVLVTVFDQDSIPYSVSIAQNLRRAGIRTELYTGSSKLRGQFGLANDKSIPLVIIAGPDEIRDQSLTLKNMDNGKQRTVSLNQTVAEVIRELKKPSPEKE
jgi:histidyl-tRNA synthetase